MTARYALIANPRSAGGRTGARLGEITQAASVLGDFEVLLTEGVGHATVLAREAVDRGFDRIIAVGGDGTLNEVVCGLFDGKKLRRDGIGFSIISAGTGGDFIKSLGLPTDPHEAFRALAIAKPRPIDVLHLSFTGHDGSTVERIGVNVTGFGVNGEVVERANRSSKRWGGRATFLAATVQSIRSYTPERVRVSFSGPGGDGEWEGDLSAGFIANGHFCGGGMWVGRGGLLDDGLAELTLVPALPAPRMLLGVPRLLTGQLERVKGVSRNQVHTVSVHAEKTMKVRIDVDGEQPGFLPIQASVLHKSVLVYG